VELLFFDLSILFEMVIIIIIIICDQHQQHSYLAAPRSRSKRATSPRQSLHTLLILLYHRPELMKTRDFHFQSVVKVAYCCCQAAQGLCLLLGSWSDCDAGILDLGWYVKSGTNKSRRTRRSHKIKSSLGLFFTERRRLLPLEIG
jgi:hypothetical protein